MSRRDTATAVAAAVLVLVAIPTGTTDSVAVGVVHGMSYAAVALGLALVLRGTGVLSLAHGPIAALAAFVAWALATDPDPLRAGQFRTAGAPWIVAALAGLAAGALAALALERLVMRRLRAAHSLVLLLATFGAGQLLTLLTYLLWIRGRFGQGSRILPPPFDAAIDIGHVRLLGEHLITIVLVPAAAVVVALFLMRTRAGLSLRAAADHPQAAALAGISVQRASTLAWLLGGALASLAGILLAGMQRSVSLEVVGFGFLIRGIAALVLGGSSLPRVALAGVAIGVGEALLGRFVEDPGFIELVVFIAVLAVSLASSRGGREAFGRLLPPPSAPSLPALIRRALVVACIALLVLLPQVLGPTSNFVLSLMLVYAVVGVSLNLLMGDAGLISLGHFAFAGIGAFAGARLVSDAQMPYVLAIAFATLAGAAAAFVIGIAVIRMRGFGLALATLMFAVAAEGYVFRLRSFGSLTGVPFPRPSLFGVELDAPSGRAFTYLCAFTMVLTVLFARGIQKRRSGRALHATRENERAAATFGVPVRGYRVLAFTISGGIAALAGTLYGMLVPPVQYASFEPVRSLELTAMVVIGGLGSAPGAVLGAVYLIGLQRAFAGSPVTLWSAVGFGTLGVLLFKPAGLWGIATSLVERRSRRVGASSPKNREASITPEDRVQI